jgi:16S rRNA pseudouridine516 synthase
MPRSEPKQLRLDRFLCEASGLPRRRAQTVIRAAQVLVNGAAVTDPGAHIGAHDQVSWRGRPVTAPTARYFMLNKPPGVVCATRDRRHRTVLELLDAGNRLGLHVVGRLDIDATGLVLITDDGEWSHRITAPRRKLPKTYRVVLATPLDPAAAATLERGVRLRNEPKPCAPAAVEGVGGTEVRITITEGKYHQIKRMLAAVGNHVLRLHRESIGPIRLDPQLEPGAYRELSAEELERSGS